MPRLGSATSTQLAPGVQKQKNGYLIDATQAEVYNYTPQEAVLAPPKGYGPRFIQQTGGQGRTEGSPKPVGGEAMDDSE